MSCADTLLAFTLKKKSHTNPSESEEAVKVCMHLISEN